MNGDEIKVLFEQLDDRGKRYVEAILQAELKHTREGLQTPYYKVLADEAGNLSLKGEKRQNEG